MVLSRDGGTVARKKGQPVPPLRRFNFGLVNEKLEGLYVNVSRDLERRAQQAQTRQDRNSDRCLVLLQIMIRFAWTSYRAVAFLAADVEDDRPRKPTCVLLIPPINRQLLDLLFSLAYMLDDFSKRSLLYQQAGWRELFESEQQQKTAFSSNKEWHPHFRNLESIRAKMAEWYSITPEQQKNRSLIPYWQTPLQLKDEKTKCRPFLRYLEDWLYRDTSAQAHLSFGGLYPIAMFLLPDLMTDQFDKFMRDRSLEQYRFVHISRTAVIFLAIATEMDTYCTLQNREAINYLWAIFNEHVAEAKEMWEIRYANR